ncbi:MAG TPA: glycosyltransferase family 4 protein [Candidatus Ozemobacteraceae bacterium]|nr:glycosyltransferase family 4 protein [Candidatus Ozemobacteraceae bacterium]
MDQARQLGIADRVRHFGWRDDLPTVIGQMDLGLITSTGSEANCRVALEFMASGKPVVATTVGVIPEILVDGEQGFLAAPRAAEPLAQGLARLLNNPALRLRLGRQALEHCRANFGLDLFTHRTEHVYQHALQRRTHILGGSL